jgi:aryl-alcohol dehydrogenase-like predicted oxidoreductase
VAEPTGATNRPAVRVGHRIGQLVDVDDGDVLDPLDDELRDAVALVHLIVGVRIGVDHQHHHLVAIAGVDEARGVHQRHAVLQRQPAAREDKTGVALGDRDGNAGLHERAATAGRQEHVLLGDQIGAGVARPGIRRQHRVGVDPADGQLSHPREPMVRAMELRTLGGTGVRVSKLCFGAMMLGAWGNRDHDDGVRIIHAALDAGINFLDTADVYSDGESEEIVGKALAGGRRDDVVLATKVHAPMGKDPNMAGNSRRWIIREVENSLRRLGTDWIDLYQIHRPDPHIDIDETLGALTDLVRSGKVRYLGSSTFPAEQIVEAQWVAARRNRERFVCEQPPYSIFARRIEGDLLPTCQRHRMGVIAWSPLNGGWLTGKYRQGAEPPPDSRGARMGNSSRFFADTPENRRKYDLIEELDKIASDAGVSLTHLAQAFVLEHPAVTSAIIGPRTMDQLTDLLAGADVRLDDAILDRIDELVPPGTDVNPADHGWDHPALQDASLRRR